MAKPLLSITMELQPFWKFELVYREFITRSIFISLKNINLIIFKYGFFLEFHHLFNFVNYYGLFVFLNYQLQLIILDMLFLRYVYQG